MLDPLAESAPEEAASLGETKPKTRRSTRRDLIRIHVNAHVTKEAFALWNELAVLYGSRGEALQRILLGDRKEERRTRDTEARSRQAVAHEKRMATESRERTRIEAIHYRQIMQEQKLSYKLALARIKAGFDAGLTLHRGAAPPASEEAKAPSAPESG